MPNHFSVFVFTFVGLMVFYYNDGWLGYLADQIIHKCIAICNSECPGCRDTKISPILHLHQQLSLLDKLTNYFEQTRAQVLQDVEKLYIQISDKLPHSKDEKQDKVIYCNVGRNFLITCTAQSLYFGRYITDMNDNFIAEVANKLKKTKTKVKRNKADTLIKPKLDA